MVVWWMDLALFGMARENVEAFGIHPRVRWPRRTEEDRQTVRDARWN